MKHLYFSATRLQNQQVEQALQLLGLPSTQIAIKDNTSIVKLPENLLASEPEFHQHLLHTAQQTQCDIALLTPQHQASAFKLLTMDMDSTLITIECIDEIADFAGKKQEVAQITEAAMRGEITDFSDSLRRRVALLKGVPANCLESVYHERLRLSEGANELIAFAKQSGWKTLLVSGGFTFFTEKMKSRLHLDYTRANTLEIIDGLLTGQVLGPIVDAQTKQDTLLSTCEILKCSPSQAIAIGDGANDLKMMAVAGASVAFHAKPAVQTQTQFCINHGGLDTLVKWFSSVSTDSLSR